MALAASKHMAMARIHICEEKSVTIPHMIRAITPKRAVMIPMNPNIVPPASDPDMVCLLVQWLRARRNMSYMITYVK